MRADARSRRASSLAPETPAAATPYRDALHGSETGRRLSWRGTAALLQAHARRFSSSSGLDRPSQPQHLGHGPEPESSEARLHPQRADSSNSAALGYADLLPKPSARPQQPHGLPKGVHKSADGFDSSKRLTPQSVISGFIGRSTTPSEAGDHPDQDHREMSPQQHTLDKYAAQVNVAADQHGLPRQPLEYRDAPRISRAERQVKRSLSSVQPRAWSLSSYHYGHTPSQGLQECSGHGFSSNQAPSSSSPSLEAKRQRFQHIVPYSPPSSGSGSECMEGQHTPAPLPINELARQAALDSLNVMNNPPATALHDIAVCAASAFQVPVVVITLIGDTTVWCQVCIHLYLSICCVSCPPLTHSLTHSLTRPPARSLTHSPTHPPTRSPTRSLTRSLTCSLAFTLICPDARLLIFFYHSFLLCFSHCQSHLHVCSHSKHNALAISIAHEVMASASWTMLLCMVECSQAVQHIAHKQACQQAKCSATLHARDVTCISAAATV